MPHLKFIIDKNYDSQMVRVILQINDPAGLESRAKSMGIELSVAEKINKSNQEKANKLIESIINQRYEAIGDKLETTRQWYQQSWDEINDDFFNFIAKKTSHNWQHQEYFCVVSVIHPGLSNWGGNKIVRIWSENPFTMRRITAHELIISHIFSIFHNFWPWVPKHRLFYYDHNYPMLVELQKKLAEIYKKAKNFDEFLDKAINEVLSK